jgi:ABC-type transport system involved in multi-copper enzyme maturation permease subunit
VKSDRSLALVRDEIRRYVRAPWVLVGTALLILLTWGSITIGQRDYEEQIVAFQEQVQARLQLQLRGGHATGRAVEPALRALRPPSPWAILVHGQEGVLPASWDFTPGGSSALASYGPAERATGGGILDLEGIVRFFAGVLALAMGASGVVRDKSAGWISILRTLPIPPGQVVATRLIGGCLTLTLMTVIWWSALLVILSPTSGLSGPRLWLLGLPVLAYLWVLFALGAAAGWQMRSGFRSGLVALTGWLLVAVIGPALIPVAIQIVWPVPPVARMERERGERYADAIRLVEQTVGRQLAERLPKPLHMPEDDALATKMYPQIDPAWVAAMADARAGVVQFTRTWEERRDAQRQLVWRGQWLSPGSLFGQAMSEWVDTGRYSTQAWERAVASEQVALSTSLFDDRPKVNLRVPDGPIEWPMAFDRHSAPRFDDVPKFVPPDPPWKARLAGVQGPMLGLLTWAALSVAIAQWTGVRHLRKNTTN